MSALGELSFRPLNVARWVIWGLTAMMVVELVNLIYDAGIELREPPHHYSHYR